MNYAAKNAQVATSLLTTSRYQDAFAWLATACCSSLLQVVNFAVLLQLVDI